jgi:hypothetical protein
MASGSKRSTQTNFYRENQAVFDPQIVHSSSQSKGAQIIVERPHTCLAIGSDLNSNMTKINSTITSAISSSLNSIQAAKSV